MRIPRKPVALCCAVVLAGTFAPAAMADDDVTERPQFEPAAPAVTPEPPVASGQDPIQEVVAGDRIEIMGIMTEQAKELSEAMTKAMTDSLKTPTKGGPSS